ncbi:MAG: hypothetical protein AAFU71_18955, partial [Cyanobacteria bacterium J06632_22]
AGTQTIEIPILEDSDDEPNETVNLQLSGDSAVLGGQTQATLTIVDNDTVERSLFFTESELQAVRDAIQVTDSHHAQAYAALKQRVDQAVALGDTGWQIYDENLSDNNWNYARAWLSREAAFLYRLTDDEQYAQAAYSALQQMYDDPDPDLRLPNQGYGLARAATGMGLALAYDWAFSGWTSQQQQYIYGKIIEALDAWPSYGHPNLSSGGGYGSNWVAVSRGAETVMMLAVSEEGNRANRFDNLRFWLNEHLKTNYGDIGLSQEGIGYISYGGGFLVPAIYALRQTGLSEFVDDGTPTDVFDTFTDIDFWQLPTYLGAWDAEQTALQTGSSWIGFDPEGWTSLLLDTVPTADLPYYQYVYDAYRGINNSASPDAKFDQRRAGTVWSLLYYPTDSVAENPNGVLPLSVEDSDKGGYFFRNRWQDLNDVRVAMLGHFEHHRYAHVLPDAFALRLGGYDTYFFGGPRGGGGDPKYRTKLLIEGQAGDDKYTANKAGSFFESRPTGGYAMIDGGEIYQRLGVDSAERHLLVDFSGNVGSALMATLDRIENIESLTYTWQASLGTSQDQGGVTAVTTAQEAGLTTVLLLGQQNSYLKLWILNPSEATVSLADPNVADSPLKIETTASDADIWVAMVIGTGQPPTATVTGTGLETQLQLGNALVYFDPSTEQIITETIANPLLTVMGSADDDTLVGNAGANNLWGLGGTDTLTGGSGYDGFGFRAPSDAVDTITDFGVDDRILLSAQGFGLVEGAEITDLGNGRFSQGSVEFLYTNGLLSVDLDGPGPQAAQALANLLGAPTLMAHQLQVVADV